ncbi:hypothetical protein, partial [Nitrolancea hollandica]|uniref:hypothetical protein n=1 Tax=Nitrolancea hollandica TaxID=1206749 RepID=UPI001EE66960
MGGWTGGLQLERQSRVSEVTISENSAPPSTILHGRSASRASITINDAHPSLMDAIVAVLPR